MVFKPTYLLIYLIFPVPFAMCMLAMLLLGIGRVDATHSLDGEAGLNACELPCWQRIEPGVTGLSRVDIVMTGLNYTLTADNDRSSGVLTFEKLGSRTDCIVEIHYANDRVQMVLLKRCAGSRLGDFIARLGVPESVFSTGRSLAFRQFSVVLGVADDLCGKWLSMYTPVLSVRLTAVGSGAQDSIRAWRGFMPYWRYIQLQPEMRPAECG